MFLPDMRAKRAKHRLLRGISSLLYVRMHLGGLDLALLRDPAGPNIMQDSTKLRDPTLLDCNP